jgi:hypothetical protein
MTIKTLERAVKIRVSRVSGSTGILNFVLVYIGRCKYFVIE